MIYRRKYIKRKIIINGHLVLSNHHFGLDGANTKYPISGLRVISILEGNNIRQYTDAKYGSLEDYSFFYNRYNINDIGAYTHYIGIGYNIFNKNNNYYKNIFN